MIKSRSAQLIESIGTTAHRYILDEASLGRIIQHLAKNRSLAMITAFRGGNSRNKNKARNKDLAKLLRDSKYGFFPIEGHYPEVHEPEEIGSGDSGYERLKDTIRSGDARRVVNPITSDNEFTQQGKEESFFVIDNKDDPIQFRDFMIELGRKFDQDSVFYRDPIGHCFFLYTSNVNGKLIGELQKINGNLLLDDLGDFFSKIKGKSFTFQVARRPR